MRRGALLCALAAGTLGTCRAGEPDRETSSFCNRPCADVLPTLQSIELVPSFKEPAILRGKLASALALVPVLKNRSRLLARFGRARVAAFGPAEGALLRGVGGRRLSVGEVLERATRTDAATSPLHVFDGDVLAGRAVAALLPPVPSELRAWASSKLLSLGSSGAGFHFHVHGPSLLTLFSGQKRWYLQKAGSFPNRTASVLHRSIQYWEAAVLPELGLEAPKCCMQHAGDTLFVPGAWAHATVNLKEAVGMAFQTPRFSACEHGNDYFCLQQHFDTAYTKWASGAFSRREASAAFTVLYRRASRLTRGRPFGFLRYIDAYWAVDVPAARGLFERMRGPVVELLEVAAPHSGDAVVAAHLLAALATALMRREPADAVAQATAKELLRRAALRAPEGFVLLGV